MKLENTGEKSKYPNVLIYGKSGIGKTPLAATAPKPIFIDIDDGILSISHLKLPCFEVRTMEGLEEVYEKLSSKWGKKNFETIVLDSGFELVDIVLQDLKNELLQIEKEEKKKQDKRQAYMKVAEQTKFWIRKFRDLKYNFIMTSYEEENDSDDQLNVSFPGKVLPREIPGLFDQVLSMHYKGKEKEKNIVLQCQADENYHARDRSKTLDKFEKLDMKIIFNKIKKKSK